MVKHLIVALALAACTAAPAPDAAIAAAISDPALITGPTEQALTLPADFDHGEINMETITGEAVCWPGDTFGSVIRVQVDDHCPADHGQRVGGLAVEVAVNNAVAGVERTAVAMECSAAGGATTNNCLEALAGDVVVDQGDVTLNHGNVFAAGYVATLSTLYAEGPGGLSLYTHDTFASIRALPGPPAIDDTPHAGSLVLDTATPALWLFDGTTWKRVAMVP